MLKYILILSLFLFQQNLLSQSDLDNWSKERASLLIAYKEKSQKFVAKKISKIEDQVINYIQTNGYPVRVIMPQGTEGIEVRDAQYPLVGNVINTLKNNQKVLLLNKDKYGYYKIKVNDQIGYVYNIVTTPQLEEYPLELLTQALNEEEAVDDLQGYPSIFTIQREYFSVQCSSHTHAGKRCENVTQSSNGRCHLH